MRRRIWSPVLSTLLLAGCLAPGNPAPAPSPRPSTAKTSPATKGSPAASASPGAKAQPTLVRPLADGARLAGRIRADAAYMRATGKLDLTPSGDALIGADGASMVAAGAGNAIAVTGAQLQAKGGLGMVAAGAGNVLAAGGLSLIGPDGASLVGPDGASLVGPDGASLVGPDGANLIGRTRYGLAQAGEAGRQVPVGGMLVSVVSLSRREYLPIGETPDGKPVYTVFTDAAGGFDLTVPKGEEANVMVVASLAGRQEPGTILNALTPPASAIDLDEDTAQVTRYLRRAMVRRLADLMTALSLEDALRGIGQDEALGAPDSPARELFRGIATTFRRLGERRGITKVADPALARAQAEALTAAVIDDALADLDLDGLQVDATLTPRWGDPALRLPGFEAQGSRAIDVLRTCFQTLRARAATRMARPDGTYAPLPPDYFARVAIGSYPMLWVTPAPGIGDWLAEVFERYPLDPYPITKPGELGDFLVDRYVGRNREFISEPVTTAFRLLDPTEHPASPSNFPEPGAGGTAARAILARINAKLAGLGIAPIDATDPQFGAAGHAANRPYAIAVDAAGLALTLRIGLAMTGDASRLDAFADGVVLPTKAP